MANETKTLVLVADDEPSTRALVVGHLKRKGYRVVEASDGDEAWALAHEHLPDLVVLDVMMPGMSGWEVCRKIRESRELGHTKVIMITGIGERLNEMTSPLFGADRYLDKPFQLSELDDAIAAVVGSPKPATKKPAAPPAKKPAAKKAPAKKAEKPAATKAPAAKKPAAKKPAAKKPAPKKPAAKKPAAKSAPAPKPAAKKAPAAAKKAAPKPKPAAKKVRAQKKG